jgi:dihydroorotase
MVPPARRPRTDRDDRPRVALELVLAGRAFLGGRLQPVEIAIGEDGRIQSIGKVRGGAPRHDVGERVLLPAATDLHVHFREPGGPPDAETIPTGTAGAAIGGVGLVGEMPNTVPAVTDLDALRDKAARVAGRAAVDVLLYASPSIERERLRLSRSAGGFKVFLSPTTGISDPPPLTEVPGLLRELAPLGLPVAVHAEDPRRFAGLERPQDPVDWNARRPPQAELTALDALDPAPDALRLHVAHVTTREAADRLRHRGVSFEATPHHLLLSDRSGHDARTKVNPPLRTEAQRAGLWDAFRRGEVPILASDHAPHPASEKSLPFDRAPSGVPGVETMVPLMLSRIRSGELDLATFLRAACDRPARWLGQPMGRMAPGHRANLLVVDFRKRTTLEGRRLRSPCGWSPFEGWEAIFPDEHYRDGVRIVEQGELVGRASGRVVRPEFAPS